MSGGGSYGDFGAGILNGWSAAGTKPIFKLVTGISTGALIAPFTFLGENYDHVLKQVYTLVETKDIMKIKGMNPRASSGLKRKLASLATFTPQQSCEEFFD